MAEKKKEILLVEDNEDDVELALHAFQKCRMDKDVVVVRDGEAALDYLFRQGDYLERKSGDPMLILLDLNLPGVSGLEVLRRVKDDPSTRRVPVVVLTTSTEQMDIFGSYDLGANSYIRKPPELTSFNGIVDQLSAYWLVANTPPPL